VSLQTRVTTPTGVPGDLLAREIGIKLQQTAEDILTGLPPDKYVGATERYRVLYELLRFMEDYIAEQAKGEGALDDE
jgi:hypothetical protein